MIHSCNKEELIQKMKEDVRYNRESTSLVNNDIKYMKEKLDKIEYQLDKFIVKADRLYATKAEVQDVRSNQKSFFWRLIWTMFTIIMTLIAIIINFITNYK